MPHVILTCTCFKSQVSTCSLLAGLVTLCLLLTACGEAPTALAYHQAQEDAVFAAASSHIFTHSNSLKAPREGFGIRPYVKSDTIGIIDSLGFKVSLNRSDWPSSNKPALAAVLRKGNLPESYAALLAELADTSVALTKHQTPIEVIRAKTTPTLVTVSSIPPATVAEEARLPSSQYRLSRVAFSSDYQLACFAYIYENEAGGSSELMFMQKTKGLWAVQRVVRNQSFKF